LAKIDPTRRGEIGRERRAKTQEQLTRLSPGDVLNIIQGILRALGVSAEDTECALRRLDKAAAAMRGAGSALATHLI
jgi:hypothetical protein